MNSSEPTPGPFFFRSRAKDLGKERTDSQSALCSHSHPIIPLPPLPSPLQPRPMPYLEGGDLQQRGDADSGGTDSLLMALAALDTSGW